MVCQICGTNNPDNAIYCASCGTRLPQNNARAYAQHTYTAPSEYSYSAEYSNPDARWRASVKPGDPSRNWAGVTGFIMGILSVVGAPLGSLLALPGLIISIIGRKSQQRGLAIAGIVTSILGLVIVALLLIGLTALVRYGGNDFYDYFSEFGDFDGYAREYLSALVSMFMR
ncbi:MAG: zinc-ribbon domain-containing protein [Oscillospiraceae bacterium]|nr:zinc-ribbon domain-containing protein [Oscillospiraceae bacterium]